MKSLLVLLLVIALAFTGYQVTRLSTTISTPLTLTQRPMYVAITGKLTVSTNSLPMSTGPLTLSQPAK